VVENWGEVVGGNDGRSSMAVPFRDSEGLPGPSVLDRGDFAAMMVADIRLSVCGFVRGGGMDMLALSGGTFVVSGAAFRRRSAVLGRLPRSECVE
jgi:hypothetical protein